MTLLVDRPTFRTRALLLGQRIDVRTPETPDSLATAPLTLRAGADGCAVLFRYGAVVLFGLDGAEELAFLRAVRPHVAQPLDQPEHEGVTIAIASDRDERVEPDETLTLHDATVPRLQTVASILGKSVALAHFEARMSDVFERIEPLATKLRDRGVSGSHGRELLREIGDVLLMRQQMIGRVEIIDKPELVWERPDLDRLYTRLQGEYELVERHRALEAKLDLIGRTAQTVLDIEQAKRTLRVEWYIVILILVEIVILLYDLFLR